MIGTTNLQIRMILNLIDRRLNPRRLQSSLQMLNQIVRDTDGLRAAGVLNGLHLGPGALQVLGGLGPEGRMDQVEVHVIQLEFCERGGEGLLNGYPFAAGGLCRHEEFGPVDS